MQTGRTTHCRSSGAGGPSGGATPLREGEGFVGGRRTRCSEGARGLVASGVVGFGRGVGAGDSADDGSLLAAWSPALALLCASARKLQACTNTAAFGQSASQVDLLSSPGSLANKQQYHRPYAHAVIWRHCCPARLAARFGSLYMQLRQNRYNTRQTVCTLPRSAAHLAPSPPSAPPRSQSSSPAPPTSEPR